MYLRGLFGFCLITLAAILTACNMPAASTLKISQTGGAKTWIDAPLDGAVIPPQVPYPLVIHAYDPFGVAQLELSLNGALLTTLKPSADQQLAVFNFNWLPQAPGNVTLLARAQGKNGLWNSQASVVVSVGVISPTPTFTPTALTITPTFTPTPLTITITPTPTYTPTLPPAVKKELTFTARVSTRQIYSGSCGTGQVTIQGLVSDPASVRSLVIFTKVQDQSSGQATGWDGGKDMSSAGSGWYQVTLSAKSIPNHDAYKNSLLLYQFVATGDGGEVLARSQTYSDVSISACSAPPPVKVVTTVAPRKVPKIWVVTKTFIIVK